MREVELEELRDLLRQAPVMVDMQPLTLAFLPKDVQKFEQARELVATLDMPTTQPTKPMIATEIEPAFQHRMPAVRCTHDPLTTELNRVLLKRYDFIQANMLRQSQVADEIVRPADLEAVALMLVDGLSYAEVRRHATVWLGSATPILVDGISITEHGMLRIIGNPPLAMRLFDMGFQRALGFTYWERAAEPLTDRIFAGFGDRVHKVKSFDEALGRLEKEALRGAFVQIIRMGLDGVAHHYRETPNIKAMVCDIFGDFERLMRVFESNGISAWLHLTSDHGLLWTREHNLQRYEFGDVEHLRHYEHAKRGEHVLEVEFEGKEFAMLEYPYLRRELRTNEWGAHGGLSFEESVVPWVGVMVGQ